MKVYLSNLGYLGYSVYTDLELKVVNVSAIEIEISRVIKNLNLFIK